MCWSERSSAERDSRATNTVEPDNLMNRDNCAFHDGRGEELDSKKKPPLIRVILEEDHLLHSVELYD
jgi:hypothetical protein